MSFRKTGVSVPRLPPPGSGFLPGSLPGLCLNLGPRCSRAFCKAQGTQAEARGLVYLSAHPSVPLPSSSQTQPLPG